MSKKNYVKDGFEITGIVLLVIVFVFIFILSMGSILPGEEKKSITSKYNQIDFNTIYTNIEQAIQEKNESLIALGKQKKKIEDIVKVTIMLIKVALAFLWVGFNIVIYHMKGSQYDINQFILWNQAILIVVLFILFMISEKYSNIHRAFSALKQFINKKVLNGYGIDDDMIKIYAMQIHMLESIYHVHPGIFHEIKHK